jgi:spermidine/putrescine-binding protein
MRDDEEDLVRQVYILQWQLANLVHDRDRLRRQLEQAEDELRTKKTQVKRNYFSSSQIMTFLLAAGNGLEQTLIVCNPVDFLI